MERRFRRTAPILVTGLLVLAACTSEDNAGLEPGDVDAGDGADADLNDAAATFTHSGTIAITEATITNPDIEGAPVRGALVSISFVDDTTAIAPLTNFANNIGQCAITVYEEGQTATSTDEGRIDVTGIAASGDFTCNANAGAYRCQSMSAAAAGGSVNGATLFGNGTGGSLTKASGGFPATMIGTTVVLSGFPYEPVNGIPFGVLEVTAGGALLLADVPNTMAGGGPGGTAVGDVDSTYTSFVGTGPIVGLSPGFDFIDGGVVPITLTKDSSDFLPALTVTAPASGEGFTLSEDSAQPHEFPTAPVDEDEDVRYVCANAGCGTTPETGSLLHAIIIDGEASDGSIEGLSPTAMPEAESNHVTFQCAYIATTQVDHAATIPAAAVNEILDTNPTRVKVTVGRYTARSGVLSGDGIDVIIGHTLTGFTDIPAAARLRR